MTNNKSPSCPNCINSSVTRKASQSTFEVYYCNDCNNGFTHPVPKDLNKYYQNHYWTSSNMIGRVKDIVFDIFHKRRVAYVTKKISEGSVLDVGSGTGRFGASLPERYKVINQDPFLTKTGNNKVITQEFLKWKTNKKFDAICFWESLEHTAYPERYLEKAYKLLKDGGYVFIEYPRYDSLESKIFGKYWFHLDLPRHLSHLTKDGLTNILTRSSYKILKTKSVISPDYAPWGFVASILRTLKINPTDDIKKSGNIVLFILIIPLGFLALVFEAIMVIISQSPIGLVVAQKK